MAVERGFRTINSIPLTPSTLENIDTGFFEYIDEKLNIHTRSNEGYIKVPTLWLASERTHQIKNNRNIRDTSGQLKLPLLTIERTSVDKDPSFKGAFQADFRQKYRQSGDYNSKNVFVISKRIVSEKTRNHSVNIANKIKNGVFNTPDAQGYYPILNKKVVYEEVISPLPSYVSIMYTIVLRSEYQQQMNDMLSAFIASPGNLNYFVFSKNNYNYEAFIQPTYAQNNNNSSLGENERSFETKIEIKVLGHINGDENSDLGPRIVTKETYVDIKISKEQLVFPDGSSICGEGFEWSNTLGRCVEKTNLCAPGQVWDETTQQCVEETGPTPVDIPTSLQFDGAIIDEGIYAGLNRDDSDPSKLQSTDPTAPNYVDPSDAFSHTCVPPDGDEEND